jgi:putative endonuclease
MRILERGFRSRLGEIDIVAQEGATIVFVEVKTRRARAFGLPEESVTALKQRRLIRMAGAWLSARGMHGRDCRFDVVAIEEGPSGAVIRHLRDAFRT